MSPPLKLIDTSDSEADRIVHENQLIDEALHFLDRRLFTRGPSLASPDAVASYLKAIWRKKSVKSSVWLFWMPAIVFWHSRAPVTGA